MNPPGSREELEAMGFAFESRTKCRSDRCGATIEFWRGPSGRLVPFRLHPTGKLFQHSDECPDKYQFRGKRTEEKPIPEKPKEKPKKKTEPQGVLF